jgi:hypothetical protein
MDQLVEFKVYCFGVAVLRILDQENHEEGHDRRTSINYKLPGIGEAKDWTRYDPGDDDCYGNDKRPWRAKGFCSFVGKLPKKIVHERHLHSRFFE